MTLKGDTDGARRALKAKKRKGKNKQQKTAKEENAEAKEDKPESAAVSTAQVITAAR